MEEINVIQTILSVATVELVFVIVVFKLILSNYEPPIQESIQALGCVFIGVTLALLMEFSVQSFMTGVICSGLGFYGGTYVNEIRGIKNTVDKDDDKKSEKEESQ